MKTVLVTGFAPFGGERINPSWLLAQALAADQISGLKLYAAELPTAFGASVTALRTHLRKLQPDAVLCLGQAGGRNAISFERVAINCDDAPIADNAGAQPNNQRIAPRGPVAYWSTLPIHAMAAACSHAGANAQLSNSAGTFVCNHVFYQLMRTVARKPEVLGGFVHVPYLLEQSAATGMALADMKRGMLAALQVLFDAPDRAQTGSSGRIE